MFAVFYEEGYAGVYQGGVGMPPLFFCQISKKN